MLPKFPIYIISKGRWEKRKTSKMLEEMNIPYRIVVEPSEYEKYAKVIDEKKILTLPDNFSKLGHGGIPARNWVWEHSIKNNDEWHWILDDNIYKIMRFNHNMKIKCESPASFCVIEDFVSRYTNIAQAGMNYSYLFTTREYYSPLTFNTRIYSCILIRNDIPFRWRGTFNEDTDLSLRILKAGWVTVLFNAFLIDKTRTRRKERGGNTDTIYNKTNNRLEFAQSLQKQHPDVVKVVWKYNRWHHQVDYTPFKTNKLVFKPGIKIPRKVNNYGMKLYRVSK
ncbi:MAG: hypothetical protein ACTSQ8_08140 [Candidatus Helarchaeota archaeon]